MAFSPKFLADVRYQAQVLLKHSCTLGELVNTQPNRITLLCIGKNNICISCVFNGFKYTFKEFPDQLFKTLITKYASARVRQDQQNRSFG